MGIFRKRKQRKILAKAIKETSGATYWIKYQATDGEGMINVYASDSKEAKERAIDILNKKLRGKYDIYDISSI